MTGAPGQIVIAALWSFGSWSRKSRYRRGYMRLRLRYQYPQRCVRERASKRVPRRVAAWRAAETRPAAHVVARALDGDVELWCQGVCVLS